MNYFDNAVDQLMLGVWSSHFAESHFTESDFAESHYADSDFAKS